LGATGEQAEFGQFPNAVLAVDVAVSRDGSHGAVVASGNAAIGGMPQIYPFQLDQFTSCTQVEQPHEQPNAQLVALAFDGSDHLIVQAREPAAIFLVDQHEVINLPGDSVADLGHTIFHANSGRGIACASCHPEGGDDGHTWNFSDVGLRRTLDLRGGVIGSAPLHWGGELRDLPALVTDTLVHRMGGPALGQGQNDALSAWINSMRLTPVSHPADAAAVQRGEVVFRDTSVGCATCHSGDRFTNGAMSDVGTGGMFKVPSLRGLALRGPYMHDGCAASVGDRFTQGQCGGDIRHGNVAQLTSQQRADLSAYLLSL
jgi:hypothetical protein